jgi:hypothetical protein
MYGMSLVDEGSKEHEIVDRVSPIFDDYEFGQVLNVLYSMFLSGLESLDMEDREKMFGLLDIARKHLLFKMEGIH